MTVGEDSNNGFIADGERFGKLRAIKRVGTSANKRALHECLCDCGNTCVVNASNLRQGHTKSCGYLKRNPAPRTCPHGHNLGGTSSRTYESWQQMKKRCGNPNHASYPNYGARGISVCDRWRSSFENFLSDMGVRPEGTSLDRIDPNGNYDPGNCRWATPLEQGQNRRTNKLLTYDGITQTLSQWARELGISHQALSARVSRHGTAAALASPKQANGVNIRWKLGEIQDGQ